MPSRAVRIVAIAVVLAALITGALTFEGALEPGRSERNGITLEAVVGTGDWFPGSAETLIEPRAGGGVTLESRRRGLLLVSRGLAIEPDRCYTVRFRARATTKGVRLAILTENLERDIRVASIPVSRRPIEHDLRFDAAGRRRVSAAVLGSLGAKAAVVRLALAPRSC